MCIVLADTSGPQLIASRIKVCGTYLYKDPAQQLAIFVCLSVTGPPHPRGPILDRPLYRIRRDEKSRHVDDFIPSFHCTNHSLQSPRARLCTSLGGKGLVLVMLRSLLSLILRFHHHIFRIMSLLDCLQYIPYGRWGFPQLSNAIQA